MKFTTICNATVLMLAAIGPAQAGDILGSGRATASERAAPTIPVTREELKRIKAADLQIKQSFVELKTMAGEIRQLLDRVQGVLEHHQEIVLCAALEQISADLAIPSAPSSSPAEENALRAELRDYAGQLRGQLAVTSFVCPKLK